MTATSVPAPHADALRRTQEAFVTAVLPRVGAHGRVCLRHVRCRYQREELLAEMAALSWAWFLRLVRRGKDALPFVSALAAYAARAARSGRRVCGQERGKDALPPVARRRHGFCAGTLPDSSTLRGGPLDEAPAGDTRAAVPDRVAFRLDFPAWPLTHADRDRRQIDRLMAGERAGDAGAAPGLSPGRVSQLRRALRGSWRRFTGGGA